VRALSAGGATIPAIGKTETGKGANKVDRAQKAEVIDGLTERFGAAGVVVVARYQGMTVADMSKLRSQMRAVGASFKVSKNRLAKRAAEVTSAKPIADIGVANTFGCRGTGKP
jgi:ribosomal protein L10